MNSESLTILLTDIVGYTSATAKLSRFQQQRWLAKHNDILLRSVSHYNGRHVKSIGDAMLIVFRSPTDALLCAMAMQDGLYIYNQTASAQQQISVRIALNAGEVRLDKNDIFGEPVNLVSRIEKITPPGEIYFSESVYMTMNKAEVLAEPVGDTTFKGISEPIRLFRVPRFASGRLVHETEVESDLDDVGNAPYGGRHLNLLPPQKNRFRKPAFAGLVGAALVCSLIGVAQLKTARYTVPFADDVVVHFTPESIQATDDSPIASWNGLLADGAIVQAVQPNDPSRPLLKRASGFPVVDFDGRGDFMTLDTLAPRLRGMEECTLAFVASLRDSRKQILFAVQSDDLAEERLHDIFRAGYFRYRPRLKVTKKILHYIDGHEHPAIEEGFHIIVATFKNDGQVTLHVNGNPNISVAVESPARFAFAHHISLGQEWDFHTGPLTTSDYFNGQVADLVLYDRVLSNEERKVLEQFFFERYQKLFAAQ